jgi:endonuclease III
MGVNSRAPPFSVRDVEAWRSRRVEALSRSNVPRQTAARSVTSLEGRLRAVTRKLHAAYGTPHLGNFQDPTSEFVYIILSRRTPERACQRAFERLARLGGWDTLERSRVIAIARALRGCGLEKKKARAIRDGLRAIASAFGRPDLSLAEDLSDNDLFQFLVGLPELGPKSALCIMLYSFGRLAFPVDTHVGRILARLGVFSGTIPELRAANHKQKQRVLVDAVPPDLRYPLHVNLIAHGRTTCRARDPLCGNCCIRSACAHFRGPLGPTLRNHGGAKKPSSG